MQQRTSFGGQLRQFRLRVGLSQAALAEHANLSVAAVTALERGARNAPYPRTLDALARALELSPQERADLIAAATPAVRAPTADSPSLDQPVSNATQLPTWPTPLVGRTEDADRVQSLLKPSASAAQLLTLLGPGGVGKTRLACAAAAELAAEFPDGIVFVDLAPLRDARLVPATVARALDVRESGGRSARELLLEYLSERRILLVLDNFEHLLQAAPVIAELVSRCSRLAVLVTSRAALRVQGEWRFLVAPLASPSADVPAGQDISASPAVQLFVARAQAVTSDFALTARTAPAVAAVCRRLDGLPLAIELAAARVGLLGPEGLLRRLEQCLPLLTGGAVDLPERQQTLHTTLAWSYDLLEPAEQVLFRRLAIFVGGWSLEAAEAVSADADLPTDAVFDRLQVLVDTSLVYRVDDGGDEPRFGMLETVREYALARLTASGEASTTRQRHSRYYTSIAEQVTSDVIGSDTAQWYAQLEVEAGNLRSALDQALDDGEPGLRLAAALARFWRTRGRFEVARAILELAISRTSAAPSAAGVHVVTLLGYLGYLETLRGELTRGQRLGAEALARAEQLGDLGRIAYAQRFFGVTLHLSGTGTGCSMLEAAVATARREHDARSLAAALLLVGHLCAPDDPDTGRARLEDALSLGRQVGDILCVAFALAFLAMLALYAERDLDAGRLADEAANTAEKIGYHDALAMAQIVQGGRARIHGAYTLARTLYVSSIRLLWEEGHAAGACSTVEELAGLEAEEGNSQFAARLIGAVDAFCAARGLVLPGVWRMWWTTEPDATRARARSGEQPLAAAWTEGQTMRLDQVVALIAGTSASGC